MHVVPGHYVHCNLKRSVKFYNATLRLRDKKDSGLMVYAFYTMQRFYKEGKLRGIYCICTPLRPSVELAYHSFHGDKDHRETTKHIHSHPSICAYPIAEAL